jgi:hypothetical protein
MRRNLPNNNYLEEVTHGLFKKKFIHLACEIKGKFGKKIVP